MVTIVSQHTDGFSGVSKKIPSGPLYADEILNIIESAKMVVGTRRCQRDLRALAKDESDLKDIIIHAVTSGKFHQSEWCELSQPNTWAACDSYIWVEKCWIEAAHKDMSCCFYVKFCIGKLGNIVITISYHTS